MCQKEVFMFLVTCTILLKIDLGTHHLTIKTVLVFSRLYVRGEAAQQISCTIYNVEDYQLCGAVQHEDLCTTSKSFINRQCLLLYIACTNN